MNTATDITTEKEEKTQKKKICIQGYEGAFHEIASRFFYGEEKIDVRPCHTFDELVDVLNQNKEAHSGLMAIENTLGGSLMYNFNLLSDSDLFITGEVYLRIKQNLMVNPGVELSDIKEVHSHPMAIAQCREYFRKMPHIRLVETADTALSARNIKDNNSRHIGAIASTLAADLYGLDIIAPSIETNKKNHTRFLVLEHRDNISEIKKGNKVSLCFTTPHEVGSLHSVLAVLAAYRINLTKITSTPIIGSPWEYRFFLDFVVGDIGFEEAINAIRPITNNLQILGVYKKGENYEY